jgi:hypothetical protein
MNLQPAAVISLVITVVGGLALYQPKQFAWVGDQTGYSPVQPIEFSHKLHAKDNGIPCEYCHSGARKGPVAGIPAARTCMNCHSQISKSSPEVRKVAAALKEGRPIEWVRIHDLPDFARFDHSAHVTAGVACQKCHGPVETMTRIEQHQHLSMGWCVGCHRDMAVASEKAEALAAATAAVTRKDLSGRAKPQPSTECSVCHY